MPLTADNSIAINGFSTVRRLQALTYVGAASPYGIEGTLTVLPLRDLFPQ